MSMTVEVSIAQLTNGQHSVLETYRGRIVEITQTQEYFQGDTGYLQVPALIIEKQEKREIVVQPLKMWGRAVHVRRI